MAGQIPKFIALGLGIGLSVSGLAQQPGRGPHTGAPTPGTTPGAPVPQQPVVPPRPEQMAPVPPQVTYQDGQLSILAQNSTLSSILSAVKARTGAQVEMPPDTASDRVATKLGPGNPRDVLASLLQGSRFDYIFIGSPTDPEALAQVIITQHSGSSGGQAGTAASQPLQGGNPEPAMRTAGGAGRPEVTGDEEETASEPPPMPEPVQAQEAVPQPAPQPGQPLQPGLQPGQPLQPGAAISPGGDRGDNPQQNQNQVKTPEQLLQELQRMQQQQQQQQQQPQPPRE